jgi:hypothetical protein
LNSVNCFGPLTLERVGVPHQADVIVWTPGHWMNNPTDAIWSQPRKRSIPEAERRRNERNTLLLLSETQSD